MRFRNIWKCVFVGRTASYTSLHSCRGSCWRCIAICASMLQCISLHCDASLSVYSSAALKRLSVSIRTDASIEDRSIHPIHSHQRRPAAVDHWTPPYTFYPFYPSLSLSLCMCVIRVSNTHGFHFRGRMPDSDWLFYLNKHYYG